MGVVYLALDTKLEKQVAIKVVRPEYAKDPDYRRRLVSEAQLAAKLSHPNIATVYTLFEEGPDLFVVSEYVAGPSLREELSHGPLEYARMLRLFTGIAHGLEAAHTKAIIHRDLKPDNILLTEDDVPKIVDFGLAKSTRAIIASTRMVAPAVDSRTGAGTPAYMAPEQVDEAAGTVGLPLRPVRLRRHAVRGGHGHQPLRGSLDMDHARQHQARGAAPARAPRDRPRSPRCGRAAVPSQGPARTVRVDEGPRARAGGVARLVPVAPPPPDATSAPARPWWEVHQLSMTVFYSGGWSSCGSSTPWRDRGGRVSR